jgi:hypothetical protein
MTTYNSIVQHGGGIHGEHASHKRNHMDNKIDDGFRIHGREENDGDLMRQSRCDIIDQEPPLTMHEQNTLMYNIILFENELKMEKFDLNIVQ